MLAIRDLYSEIGVEEYYSECHLDYKNPHESIIKTLIEKAKNDRLIGKNVLDLCCGTGEVTQLLKGYNVTGVDPYMSKAYFNRTGKEALNLSFKDIVEGCLKDKFDTIICSFALHLCPKSMLPYLLWNLGECAKTLIVISPNKRPDCDSVSGWMLVDEYIEKRIRMKIYMRSMIT